MTEGEIAELIGARVQTIRMDRGLTQAVLAEQVGLTTSTLSRIERGAQGASLEALVRIAKALGVTLAHLVDFEGEREIPQDPVDGVLAALPGDAGVLRRRIVMAVKVLLRGN